MCGFTGPVAGFQSLRVGSVLANVFHSLRRLNIKRRTIRLRLCIPVSSETVVSCSEVEIDDLFILSE